MKNRKSPDSRPLGYGDIVRSKCGRDRKRPFMVIGTGSRNGYGTVVLADGKLRPLSRPKTKNVLHIEKIGEADLIVFSPGSLYTSILPHLLSQDVRNALKKAHAPILYVCNIVTQPGETDGYSVSDHVKVLNRYLDGRRIDMVLANNAMPSAETAEHYFRTEGKEPVHVDSLRLEELGVELIEDTLLSMENGAIRHNALKTAFQIFAILMRQE